MHILKESRSVSSKKCKSALQFSFSKVIVNRWVNTPPDFSYTHTIRVPSSPPNLGLYKYKILYLASPAPPPCNRLSCICFCVSRYRSISFKNSLLHIIGWIYHHLFILFPIVAYVDFQDIANGRYPCTNIFIFFCELSFKWWVYR